MLVVVLLTVFAVPSMAYTSTNSTAMVTGYGLFVNQGGLGSGVTNTSSSNQKISFNLWAKVNTIPTTTVTVTVASSNFNTTRTQVPGITGKIGLIDACSKKVISGYFQDIGSQNEVIGDFYLTGYCSINGRGCYPFEVGLGDECRGLGAIGRDYISFYIPSCGYSVSGTLCAGDICIPTSLLVDQ